MTLINKGPPILDKIFFITAVLRGRIETDIPNLGTMAYGIISY